MTQARVSPSVPINFHALIASTGSKDGARARFQQLVAQLLHLRNPGVRQVHARAGDWGIDCFVGELNGTVAVWQAKFFIDGVGPAQQQEIRDSFKTVLKKGKAEGYAAAIWTLCIPVSFDAATTKWWDSWKRRMEAEHKMSINLWDETQLEAMLLSPDADRVRDAYFGSSAASETELRTHPLPEEVSYDEMLFIRQLDAAKIPETDSAKRQFFNAEIMRREVADKGIEAEMNEVESSMAEAHALWETRFNESCTGPVTQDLLPGLYPAVMRAIEDVHRAKLGRRLLPMGLVHRLGTMHHVVEEGRAGWTRNYRAIASAHHSEKEAAK